MSIQALREQRDAKAKALKELANKADYNPANDNTVFDAMVDEINALEGQIDRITKANEIAFENEEIEGVKAGLEKLSRDRGKDSPELSAFVAFIKAGDKGLDGDQVKRFRADLGVGTNGAGGFTVQTDVSTRLLDALAYDGGMGETATSLRTEGGNPLLIPASDGTAEEGVIVDENTTATDLDPTFTQIPLPVYKYSSRVIPLSIELLMDSQIDVVSFIETRLMQRIGRIQNRHFTVGTGTAQPRGIVTAATVGKAGITGQTLTVTYDDLVDLEHSVDVAYRGRPDCGWMMHDLALRQIRKVKDTTGMPIFARGVANGPPTDAMDFVLGRRVTVNNHMPVMAANAKSIIFGALAEYMIRDVMGVLLQRYDDSAYAKKGQVGFNAWSRAGGNLIDNGGAVKAYQNSAT
ncbi:phage capsid protein [Polymorphobacter multimanifer]|uniref:phage major capsid protein n=1 Tax=Polymorphobacter multimanifer TaxID=1070431 RepID=UPI00166AFCB6|nr:phage major capsid protein [Polymorphobacter multimanifer]GGI82209.1 phage capsid protein [Polymorphobacter multimanifer]